MEPKTSKTGPLSDQMHPLGVLLCAGFVFAMFLLGLSYIADSSGIEGFLTGAGAIAIAVGVSKYFFGSSEANEGFERGEPKPASNSVTPISDSREAPSLQAYSLLADELGKGSRDEVLWLKCTSEAEGNEAKAQASYNRARAAALEIEEARQLKLSAEKEKMRKRDSDERKKAFLAEMKITMAEVRLSQPVFNTWGKDQLTKVANEVKSLIVKGDGLAGVSQIESLRWAEWEVSKALKSHEHDQLLLEQSKAALDANDVSKLRSALRQRRGRFQDLDYGPMEAVVHAADKRRNKKTLGIIIIFILLAVCFVTAIQPEFTAVTAMSQDVSQLVTQTSPPNASLPSMTTLQEEAKLIAGPEQKKNAEALYKAGLSYYRGDGVQQNFEKASEMFELAANEGLGDAQLALGNMYSDGVGITQSAELAMQWYLKAAEQGVADAQNNVGAMTARGEGCIANEPEAVKWYRKAAELNLPYAQFNLGMCYAYGRGVEQNRTEAAKWWTKASEQGFADAQYNLGALFKTGDGVPKNPTEAARWWAKAAVQGSNNAQEALVDCYLEGVGTPQDKIEAYKWALLASAAEPGLYADLLKTVENELTAQQKLEGESRVRMFRLLHGYKNTSRRD